MLLGRNIPIVLFDTLTDILKTISVVFASDTQRIVFAIGVFYLQKQHFIDRPELQMDIALFFGQEFTGFDGVIQCI